MIISVTFVNSVSFYNELLRNREVARMFQNTKVMTGLLAY